MDHLERRRHSRSKVDIRVRMTRVLPSLDQTFTTGMVNINYYGACLLIPASIALKPADQLKLVIVLRMPDDKVLKVHHKDARVRWTNGNRAGVQFVGLD